VTNPAVGAGKSVRPERFNVVKTLITPWIRNQIAAVFEDFIIERRLLLLFILLAGSATNCSC